MKTVLLRELQEGRFFKPVYNDVAHDQVYMVVKHGYGWGSTLVAAYDEDDCLALTKFMSSYQEVVWS